MKKQQALLTKDESGDNLKSTGITDYELVGLYISSVQTFAEVASKADLEHGNCFTLGQRLFDEAIGSISEARKKLRNVSAPTSSTS